MRGDILIRRAVGTEVDHGFAADSADFDLWLALCMEPFHPEELGDAASDIPTCMACVIAWGTATADRHDALTARDVEAGTHVPPTDPSPHEL